MINRDIIIIGQQPWDTSIGSNCKNIALELSKENRVLYVNSPLDRITLYKDGKNPAVKKRINVIRNKENGLIEVQENLWNLYPDSLVESINWIKNPSIFRFFNKRNNAKFASSIRKAIGKLGFKDYILFNDNEILKGFYLKELLSPDLSIYYSRDYMLAVDYWKRHGAGLEPQLIAKSEICLANSLYLKDFCKSYNPNSYYVGQGCDLKIFKKNTSALIPKELEHISGPIIGYVGALECIRLDLDIIKYIASNRKDWTIVLVGREDDVFIESDLHQLENVIFTGIKPVEELPTYMQFFDVCINPQLVNDVTVGNYPRKIDEYLAMGKPTVATATQTMEIFKPHVLLAEDKTEYLGLIEKALEEDSTELQIERTRFASTHSWENCVDAIYESIQKTIDKR